MASFNQSESQTITPEDNKRSNRENSKKLIADLGVVGKFKKRSGFWRKICCMSAEYEDEVINMNVPVQHLNRHLYVVINCRNTKINLKMHPQDEDEARLFRSVNTTRLKELVTTTRNNGNASCSTIFSSPFPDPSSNLDHDNVRNVDLGNVCIKRTNTF